jgi:hypothetical protein
LRDGSDSNDDRGYNETDDNINEFQKITTRKKLTFSPPGSSSAHHRSLPIGYNLSSAHCAEYSDHHQSLHFASWSMSGHRMNEEQRGSPAGVKHCQKNACPCGVLTTVWRQSSCLLDHSCFVMESFLSSVGFASIFWKKRLLKLEDGRSCGGVVVNRWIINNRIRSVGWGSREMEVESMLLCSIGSKMAFESIVRRK